MACRGPMKMSSGPATCHPACHRRREPVVLQANALKTLDMIEGSDNYPARRASGQALQMTGRLRGDDIFAESLHGAMSSVMQSLLKT